MKCGWVVGYVHRAPILGKHRSMEAPPFEADPSHYAFVPEFKCMLRVELSSHRPLYIYTKFGNTMESSSTG